MGTQPQPVQDTLKKVDQAMARLQEIQCTIAGGSKLCGGVPLSPRSTRGYLRTSLRCKQESLRMKELAMIVDEETNPDKGQQIVRSSSLRRSSSNGEWRRWSMPGFLIQQAVGEIMEASNLAKEVAHLVSNSIEDKPTESPKSAQNGLNGKPMDDEKNESSYQSNVEHFLNETERQHTDFGEKAGLQTFGSNIPKNPVHSFKVVYKDTSTLKYYRESEKEEYAARVRAESLDPNARFQRQMSFRASDQVKKQGGAKNLPASLPVSHCSSPVRFIKEKTTSAKPLVKVEQMKPAHHSWMSRSSSTKAIMFPNSAFVSSPSKNNLEVKITNASMKRKSLPSVKDLKSLRITDYPCNKEEHSVVCMVADSPTVRKSSSFSEAYPPSTSKSTKQSPMSSLLNRTLKKFHVSKASTPGSSLPPSKLDAKIKFEATPCLKKSESLRLFHVIKPSTPGSPLPPSELYAKTKFEATPCLEKSESLRFVSSSQMQDFLVRRHSMSSCDPSAESKLSRLSKQHIKALVQLPKKISSVIKHAQSVPQVGDIARESDAATVADENHRMGKTNSVLSERRKSEILASSAEDVRKQGVYQMEDHYMQSSVPITKNISANEMQRGRHVQKCNSPLNYTKVRHLRPISINSALNSFSRDENNTVSLKEKLNTTASKDKLEKQKIKLQRKENRDNVKDGEEKDKAMKKSTGFLRNSWSFTPDRIRSSHNEKLHTVTGGLPFLKNVKEWVTLQRSASSVNR